MATRAALEYLEVTTSEKRRYVPYNQFYKPKGDRLAFLPEYMRHNLTHGRRRPTIDYTRYYKKHTQQ